MIGGKSKTEPLYGHGYKWDQGYIHCTFCDTYIKRPVDMKQHTRSGRHQRQLRLKTTGNEPAAIKVYDNNGTDI